MYAQQLDGVWRELVGNIRFAPNIFQSAESLSDEQRQELNVYLIEDATRSELTNTQKYGDPVFTISGAIVKRAYPVVDKTAEEIQAEVINKAEEVRIERNQKLTESDWTQLADAPVDKTAWATYRQGLRNIPNQSGFPFNVVWDDKP
jgi:hypothetical protein